MSRAAKGLGILVTAMLLCSAAPRPGPPSDDRIPELAESLEDHLRGTEVTAPDGSTVAVSAILDRGRIETCLRTVGAAEAWPESWLVVQVEALGFDVVLPVRLDDDEAMAAPDPVFAATRREWSVDVLRDAIREQTGRKARGRNWNLVVQGFRTRIEQHWVYEIPTERRGLLAMLEEGTLLREAKRIELPDGQSYTIALVMQQAEFVPSSCDDCTSRVLGHADTGRILLVLTDDAKVLDRVDLTSLLATPVDRPLLPRYPCDERDAEPGQQERTFGQRFAERDLVPLLVLRDLDGDGVELEIELTSGVETCEPSYVSFAVVPLDTPKLYVVPR